MQLDPADDKIKDVLVELACAGTGTMYRYSGVFTAPRALQCTAACTVTVLLSDDVWRSARNAACSDRYYSHNRSMRN